jgi:hypothetical protein
VDARQAKRSTPGFYGRVRLPGIEITSSRWRNLLQSLDTCEAAQRGTRRSFPFGFFQFAIDPKMDSPDGQQVELGFGFAGNESLADMKLPFPDVWRDRSHGEFNALVDHTAIPSAILIAFKLGPDT